MTYTSQKLSKTKLPTSFAFSCFDNAVRFAYFHANKSGMDYHVVGGNNAFGVHYDFCLTINGQDMLGDDTIVDGVKVRLSLKDAVTLRNHLLKNNHVRVSPPDDDSAQDKVCALAPSLDQALAFVQHGTLPSAD